MVEATHTARVTIEYDIQVEFADDGQTELRDQAYDHARAELPFSLSNLAEIRVGDVLPIAERSK